MGVNANPASTNSNSWTSFIAERVVAANSRDRAKYVSKARREASARRTANRCCHIVIISGVKRTTKLTMKSAGIHGDDDAPVENTGVERCVRDG